MSFQIVKKDIREIRADAVVLPADPEHPAGEIIPGHVAEGRSEEFSARHVLYAACPEWTGGSTGECKTLYSCYSGALSLASNLSCKSIAFPLLAEGGCGFPEEEALQTALAAIRFFLLSHDMKVILAVPDREKLKLPRNLDREVQNYIWSHAEDAVYEASSLSDISASPADSKHAGPPVISGRSLDEVIRGAGDTFQQKLFQLIDASGMDEVTVYKRANIDRKVFSKIRCNRDYQPKKKTAVALAVALELDMPETADLLSRAGLAFSPSNTFDLIIQFFITNRMYDIFEINAALFKYGQPVLG